MYMIPIPSCLNGIAFKLFTNSTQEGIEFGFNLFIDKGVAVFGAEGDMHVNL